MNTRFRVSFSNEIFSKSNGKSFVGTLFLSLREGRGERERERERERGRMVKGYAGSGKAMFHRLSRGRSSKR